MIKKSFFLEFLTLKQDASALDLLKFPCGEFFDNASIASFKLTASAKKTRPKVQSRGKLISYLSNERFNDAEVEYKVNHINHELKLPFTSMFQSFTPSVTNLLWLPTSDWTVEKRSRAYHELATLKTFENSARHLGIKVSPCISTLKFDIRPDIGNNDDLLDIMYNFVVSFMPSTIRFPCVCGGGGFIELDTTKGCMTKGLNIETMLFTQQKIAFEIGHKFMSLQPLLIGDLDLARRFASAVGSNINVGFSEEAFPGALGVIKLHKMHLNDVLLWSKVSDLIAYPTA